MIFLFISSLNSSFYALVHEEEVVTTPRGVVALEPLVMSLENALQHLSHWHVSTRRSALDFSGFLPLLLPPFLLIPPRPSNPSSAFRLHHRVSLDVCSPQDPTATKRFMVARRSWHSSLHLTPLSISVFPLIVFFLFSTLYRFIYFRLYCLFQWRFAPPDISLQRFMGHWWIIDW